jgi:hypothetical protein
MQIHAWFLPVHCIEFIMLSKAETKFEVRTEGQRRDPMN